MSQALIRFSSRTSSAHQAFTRFIGQEVIRLFASYGRGSNVLSRISSNTHQAPIEAMPYVFPPSHHRIRRPSYPQHIDIPPPPPRAALGSDAVPQRQRYLCNASMPSKAEQPKCKETKQACQQQNNWANLDVCSQLLIECCSGSAINLHKIRGPDKAHQLQLGQHDEVGISARMLMTD